MGRGRTLTKYSTRVLAGVALVAGALAIPVHAGAEPTTQTFSYTGGVQEFVVPTGVCLVRIDAYGAQGGESGGEIRGGFGGRAAATITVTPGEVLKIRVGGKPTGTTGGFNGGGDGGIGTENESEAKGGGGASDVRQGGDGLANRVVVAGGGGGRSNGGGEGGGGGGENGVSGTGLAGGGGASQSAGGVPGGNGEPGTAGESGDGGY